MDKHELVDDSDMSLQEVFWPNGMVKFRGWTRGSKQIGQQVSFWENGVVAEISWYTNHGVLRGTVLKFDENGMHYQEEIWDDDAERKGTYESRHYDEYGVVVRRTRFEDFAVVESWSSPPSDEVKELFDEIDLDSMIRDAVDKGIRELEQDLDANGE